MKSLLLNYYVKISVLLVVIAILMTGCGVRVMVPVTRPAEINLNGKQRLAIGFFEGNIGRRASDLIASRLSTDGYFELINSPVNGFIHGKTTPAIVLEGSVSADYDTYIQRDRWKDGKGCHITFIRTEKAIVIGTFRLVDVSTGKLIAVRNISNEAYSENSETDKYPSFSGEEELVGEALEATINDFVKVISPYREYVAVEFDKGDSDVPEMSAGIEYCKVGYWQEGIRQFRKAAEKNPTDSGAWFNLGLAYGYSGMYAEAEQALLRSNRLKPDDRCFKEISNLRRMANEQEALKNQGVSSINRK